MADFVRNLEEARVQQGAAGTTAGTTSPMSPPKPRARHVWVTGPVEDPGPWAGVMVGWDRRWDGWWGRVVYVLPGDDATVVDAWVPAASLQPIPPVH